MRNRLFLIASLLLVTGVASADEPTVVVASSGGPSVGNSDLGHVVTNRAKSSEGAGTMRDVQAPTTTTTTTTTADRPLASPRTLRRMAADRTVKGFEAALYACTAHVVASKPNLVVRLSVTATGDVERADLLASMPPAESVAACVRDAVHAAKFASPGQAGATLLVPLKGVAAPAASAPTILAQPPGSAANNAAAVSPPLTATRKSPTEG